MREYRQPGDRLRRWRGRRVRMQVKRRFRNEELASTCKIQFSKVLYHHVTTISWVQRHRAANTQGGGRNYILEGRGG